MDHAEAEVAVRHERAQRTRLGEREGGAIVAVGAHGIASVRMPRDVAEQVLGVAHERRMARGKLDDALGEALRVVDSAQPETGAPR